MRCSALNGQEFRQRLAAAVGAGLLVFSGLLTRTNYQHSGPDRFGGFSSIRLV